MNCTYYTNHFDHIFDNMEFLNKNLSKEDMHIAFFHYIPLPIS